MSTVDAQRLYVALLGRPADVSGLNYWGSQIDAAGGVTAAIITEFANNDEFRSIFNSSDVGTNMNTAYWLLFNRAGDQGGIDYWVGQINSGAYDLPGAIYAGASGSSGTDLDTYNGKFNSANAITGSSDTSQGGFNGYYTGANAATFGRNWLTWYGPNTPDIAGVNNFWSALRNPGTYTPAHQL